MEIIKRLIVCIFILMMSACQLTEQDLNQWYEVDKGEAKLAAYLVERDRPLNLRLRALDFLVQKKQYDYLLTAFKLLKPNSDLTEAENAKYTADFKTILSECLRYVKRDLAKDTTRDQQAGATDLVFIVMSYPEGEALFKQDPDLMTSVAVWALAYLRTSQTSPSKIPPKDILLAVTLIGGDLILDEIKRQMAEYQANVSFIVILQKILFDMRDQKIDAMMAEALLNTGRKVYPHGVTIELVNAMGDNNNETLLRFLIELSRDRLVNVKVLNRAIELAGSQLKEKGMENFKRILQSERSASHHLFYTLGLMWRFGGVEKLAEALKNISPKFSTPVSGAELKLEVEHFCNHYVSQKKDEARETLINLVDELGNSKRYWPARLYVLTCIHLLYPDDFPKVMNSNRRYQRYYAKDKTRIPAWRSETDVTLGDIAREYMMPLNR